MAEKLTGNLTYFHGAGRAASLQIINKDDEPTWVSGNDEPPSSDMG
jgi:hypothetical protein